MYAFVKGACPWLDEHIKSCVRRHVPDAIFVNHIVSIRPSAATVFQFCSGENLRRHFKVVNAAETALINVYPNSDALARKDCLARVVEYWTAKRPDSILKDHVPVTVRLSLDYSEYVDDALAAADDLTLLYSLEDNENKAASEREWWILKPAFLDCGAGIRLFSTVEELASNLELAANLEEEDDEQSEEVQEPKGNPGSDTEPQGDDWRNGYSPSLSLPGLDCLDALITTTGNLSVNGSPDKLRKDAAAQQYVCEDSGRILSAQMREFVAQRYIVSVPPLENRKWHIRSYALSVGRLKVHVYREMLALLALDDHKPPWDDPGAGSFLTNTAIQSEDEYVTKESMRDFWQTPDDLLPGDWKTRTFDQICEISAEVFRAAAHTMSDKFTTLDKCFGLFALDFLVDTSGTTWLLEVNETPAFYEHGFAGALSQRLMESVICVAMEHMGNARLEDSQNSVARVRMVEVLDETEKLGKSNITEIIPQD
ncbi:hypothetical protein DL769_001771 [Monosporascus sp. CRB-8-3]|nr:hypothetical protein DL769_001771 [Monosporascus sp. CRB-8-3]